MYKGWFFVPNLEKGHWKTLSDNIFKPSFLATSRWLNRKKTLPYYYFSVRDLGDGLELQNILHIWIKEDLNSLFHRPILGMTVFFNSIGVVINLSKAWFAALRGWNHFKVLGFGTSTLIMTFEFASSVIGMVFNFDLIGVFGLYNYPLSSVLVYIQITLTLVGTYLLGRAFNGAVEGLSADLHVEVWALLTNTYLFVFFCFLIIIPAFLFAFKTVNGILLVTILIVVALQTYFSGFFISRRNATISLLLKTADPSNSNGSAKKASMERMHKWTFRACIAMGFSILMPFLTGAYVFIGLRSFIILYLLLWFDSFVVACTGYCQIFAIPLQPGPMTHSNKS